MCFYKFACIISVIIIFLFSIYAQSLYAAPEPKNSFAAVQTPMPGPRLEAIMPRMLAPAMLAVPLGNEKYGDFLAVQKGAMLGAQSFSPSVDSRDSAASEGEPGGEESQVPLDYDGDGDVDIRDINIFRYILFNVYFFNNYYNSMPVWRLTTNVFVTPQLQTPWRDQPQHYKIEVPFVMPVQFSINQYLGLLANPALTNSTAIMPKLAPVIVSGDDEEKEKVEKFDYLFTALLQIANQVSMLRILSTVNQLSMPAAGVFGDIRYHEQQRSRFSAGLAQKTQKARESLATENSIAVLLTTHKIMIKHYIAEEELAGLDATAAGYIPLPQAMQYDGR